MHCKNINQFCLHLAEYYTYICQDIIGKQTTKTLVKFATSKTLLKKADKDSKIKENSSKEIVDKYMQFLSNATLLYR